MQPREGRQGVPGREGAVGREGATGATGEGEIGPVGPQGEPGVGAPLPRKVRASFIILTLVFTIVLTLLGGVIVQNRSLARDGDEAHEALCIIKHSMRQRVESTEDYLRLHPDELILGVPRALFEQRVAQDRTTLEDMRLLDCSDVDHQIPRTLPVFPTTEE